MANAPIKTVVNDASVQRFIDAVPDATRRADANTLATMMARITGLPAKMWGAAIVGFGRYHYRYDSGREGDMPLVAFSPRKAQSVLYLLSDFPGSDALRARIGPHEKSVGCLYIKRVSDVDEGALQDLIRAAFDAARAKYPDDGGTVVTSRQAAAKRAAGKKTPAKKASPKKAATKTIATKRAATKKAAPKKAAPKKAPAKQASKSPARQQATSKAKRAASSKPMTIEKRPSRGGGGNAAPRKTTLRQRAAAEAARSSR